MPVQFIQRHQAISLYKEILRALREVEDRKLRREMQVWIRGEFDKWKHTTDEVCVCVPMLQSELKINGLTQDNVRMLLSQGRMSLRELKLNIGMTK